MDTKLQGISAFARSTILELRDTIWAMNNNEIHFEDLRARILDFIEKAKIAKEDIDFKFTIEDSLHQEKLSSITGMNIYRTIQEAVNNAIKYADASLITIEVKTIEDKITIYIQDNGKGFEEDKVEKGNGLLNMQRELKILEVFLI
ncbi:MAG: ATP-binding protein [Flavobacterium sp.]|nr:ATP-binding protein [Flavobacterium sp.]